MVDNTNKLNTQYNFAIPTTQEEREKIILLAVKMLTEKEGGNITLNQLLSYVDNNLNNLSNEVAQALINKSNNGHNHDDRYYTEDEVNTKVNQLKSDLDNKANLSDLGLKVEIIYENLTSDQAFDGRTINLNKNYIAILVNYRINTSLGIGSTVVIIKGNELGVYEPYGNGKFYRFFHYNKGENIFKIGNCTELNNAIVNNNYIIPLQIYGII